ncbi:MAG: class I SAM-dependent methyltransferase [Deltaproteobacteria bacterium]|nr:class I SAM-dependent methyltransferase [Deltaproteobacteria bacterium]
MVRISPRLLEKVIASYGVFFEKIARLPAEKCARDVVDEQKVHDQVRLFCETTGLKIDALSGKKVLEVGCGFGLFVFVTRRDYGCDTVGIEPAERGFDTSYALARQIAAEYGMPAEAVINGKGEKIPFPDGTFDIVFSSTVLEHTEDPRAVLRESLRVLKPGGFLQFVFPNYGSFFEGHYAIPWIPYLNNRMGQLWVRLWGRDPAFMGTLQLLSYRQVRAWMRDCPEAHVLTYGAEVFERRMLTSDIKEWAGLGKVKGWLRMAHRLGLIRLITNALICAGSFEPVILTVTRRA